MGIIARVVLETDATLVKAAVDGDGYRLSAMSCLITEIKLLASQEFTSCIISVCPCLCNHVAQNLLSLVVLYPVVHKPFGMMYLLSLTL